jgi:hypothetical protein
MIKTRVCSVIQFGAVVNGGLQGVSVEGVIPGPPIKGAK